MSRRFALEVGSAFETAQLELHRLYDSRDMESWRTEIVRYVSDSSSYTPD